MRAFWTAFALAALAATPARAVSIDRELWERAEINAYFETETYEAVVYASDFQDVADSEGRSRLVCVVIQTADRDEFGCAETFEWEIDPLFSRGRVTAFVDTGISTITIDVTVLVSGPPYLTEFGGGPYLPPAAGASGGAGFHRVGDATGSITSSLTGSLTEPGMGWIGRANGGGIYVAAG